MIFPLAVSSPNVRRLFARMIQQSTAVYIEYISQIAAAQNIVEL